MKARLIIFDLDGTLLDTGRGILKCIASTLAKMNIPLPDVEVCKSFVGPSLKKRFFELFGADEKVADEFVSNFREQYGNGDIFLADRYPGMEESLATLREHFSLAVATNKREDHAVKLLEKFELSSYFDVICGSDATATMTKEQIVASAAEWLSVSLADCIMVGDSDNDAIAAAKLGIPFVGVTYGYGFKNAADVAHFPHIGSANTPLDIRDFIAENCKNYKNPL